MKLDFRKLKCAVGLLASAVFASNLSAQVTSELSFERAIELAVQNDPWLVQNKINEQSIRERSVGESSLPDPRLSLTAANLPTDGFDFNQEPMTQLKLGYSQMFPAGDSLQLKAAKLERTAELYPIQRQVRNALLKKQAGKLWLELYRTNKTIELIEQNQSLFEKLVDVAQISYSSAAGKTRQQDIVRAQLELTMLEELLSAQIQQKVSLEAQLHGLIDKNFVQHYQQSAIGSLENEFQTISLPKHLPSLGFAKFNAIAADTLSRDKVVEALLRHPEVLIFEQETRVKQTSVELAEQAYSPSWGISASYAYRDDDPLGNDRADFVSIGVSFELPLFTKSKQDKNLSAAKLDVAATKTKKWQAMRQLLSQFNLHVSQYRQLSERASRYRKSLLPKTNEQAEAALNAYTNDESDFAEVVRARIAELNAKIEALNIAVKQQQSILEINYLLAGVKS